MAEEFERSEADLFSYEGFADDLMGKLGFGVLSPDVQKRVKERIIKEVTDEVMGLIRWSLSDEHKEEWKEIRKWRDNNPETILRRAQFMKRCRDDAVETEKRVLEGYVEEFSPGKVMQYASDAQREHDGQPVFGWASNKGEVLVEFGLNLIDKAGLGHLPYDLQTTIEDLFIREKLIQQYGKMIRELPEDKNKEWRRLWDARDDLRVGQFVEATVPDWFKR